MRVLGIDPGYDRLGIAILSFSETGKERLHMSDCFQTDRKQPLHKRLHHLGQYVTHLLTIHQPDTIAIETLFFNKNQKTAMAVAQARGIILYLAQENGCTLYEFGPQEIKVAVTGHGGSDKKAVIDMTKRLLPDAPTNALDDEYDAIAIGITCLAHHGRGR